jgi:hypothetical protein
MNQSTKTKKASKPVDHRPEDTFGPYSLSVQASADHRSLPKRNGLPLAKYTHVDVLLTRGGVEVDVPKTAELAAFAPYFHEGHASYMAQAVLADLRKALAALTTEEIAS